ncbi:hypothetical protein Tco_0306056, partial [Tanacetum coccineum]
VERPIPPAPVVPDPVISAGTPSSTTIDQDAPSTSHLPSSSEADNDPFHNMFAPKTYSEEPPSGDVCLADSNQLATDALWCFYHSILSKVKPKNFKNDVNEDYWFEAMQEEIHEFDRL